MSVLASLLLGCLADSADPGAATKPTGVGVPVLVYHEILTDGAEPSETRVSLERFQEQMAYLADNHWTPLSVGELVGFMRGEKPLPSERSVVLTFDDGWRSVQQAIPILERYGFKASFWIISHRGIGWDNLEWEDVERIDAHPLFEVGSHTASHPWDPSDNLVTWVDGAVPGKGPADVRHELEGSRQLLEKHLGHPVRALAWPRGWYNERLVELARDSGYEAILTTDDGANRVGDDVLRIKRVYVDGGCELDAFARLLRDARYRPCAPARGPVVRRQLHSPYPVAERASPVAIGLRTSPRAFRGPRRAPRGHRATRSRRPARWPRS